MLTGENRNTDSKKHVPVSITHEVLLVVVVIVVTIIIIYFFNYFYFLVNLNCS